jgi:nicotinamidase-related amidase
MIMQKGIMVDTSELNQEIQDRMRIQKENSAGLIIDIQEKLFPHIYEHESLARNNRILVEGLKALGVPVLVTQQYTHGLGPTIPVLQELIDDFPVIEKTAFSCCDEPGFIKSLNETGKRFIIITGIESHVCVLQTVLDLNERGYVPVVVEDCVSSRKENDKTLSTRRMIKEGAILTTYESILFELCRFSGTDEFKAISRLVK